MSDKATHYACQPNCGTTGLSSTVRKHVTCEACLSVIGMDPETLDGYHFPPTRFSAGIYSNAEFIGKACEEIDEVRHAGNATDYLMEWFDVIHVAESAIRNSCNAWGIDKDTIKAAVFEKNRRRSYYAKGD